MTQVRNKNRGVDIMAINAVGSRISRAVSCALVLGTIQSVVQAAESDDELKEVVVSGSRVITNGFSAPTPITVLTAEQMQLTAPTSISDAINQLPQFRASYTPAPRVLLPRPTPATGALLQTCAA